MGITSTTQKYDRVRGPQETLIILRVVLEKERLNALFLCTLLIKDSGSNAGSILYCFFSA